MTRTVLLHHHQQNHYIIVMTSQIIDIIIVINWTELVLVQSIRCEESLRSCETFAMGVDLSGCGSLTRWLFIIFNAPILVRQLNIERATICDLFIAVRVSIARYWNMADYCRERSRGSVIRRLYWWWSIICCVWCIVNNRLHSWVPRRFLQVAPNFVNGQSSLTLTSLIL